MNADQRYIKHLEQRLLDLELALSKERSINSALSSRVEKSLQFAPSDFSYFESNAVLQSKLESKRIESEKRKQAIEDATSKLNAIINNTEQSFVLLSSDYIVLAFNKVVADDFYEHFGIIILEGMDFSKIIPEYTQKDFFANFDKALNGYVAKTERYFTKGDQRNYFYYSYYPVFNYDGTIDRVVLNVVNITELKLAQKNINDKSQFLENLLETIPMPIFYKDTKGNYLGCNVAYEKLMQIKKSDIIGKTVFEVAPLELAQKYHDMDMDLLNTKEMQLYEWQLKSNNGAQRHVVFYKDVFYDSDNKPSGLIGVILDISDRKSMEELIISKQKELQTIFDATPVLTCVLNQNFNIVNANKAFRLQTGFDENTSSNFTAGGILSCINLINTFDACGNGGNCLSCSLRMAIRNTFETGANHTGIEFKSQEQVKNEKTYKYYLCSTARIEHPNEMFVLVAFQDITERVVIEQHKNELFEELRLSKDLLEATLFQKEALIEELELSKESLKTLNAEKDKFFSILAHDLKNPFNLLINYSTKLFDDFANVGEAEKLTMIQDIKSSSESVFKLLENLLDWSRVQTGKFSFNPQVIDIYEIVYNSIFTFQSIAKSKEISIITNIKLDTLVYADFYMISTVMRNLISNAVKFTRQGGKIEINHNIHDKHIQINVSDNGIGMTQEQISRLFRIDNTMSTLGTNNEKGTGLGLILSSEFLAQHGTQLEVLSNKELGSIFSFTLPLY